jgi:hypothetical protein
MPWQDRIRQAKYTPPSQKEEFQFDYVDVSRVTEKRTTAFSFIGVNESYVQDNGYGSRKYAMRCFFTGDDHDVVATRFEAALLEDGVGQLEHPLYGSLNVVPFGSITRNNNMVRAASQSVVVVTFWTTTGVVYPSAERSPKNEVLAAIEVYDVAAAETHQDTVDVDWTVKAAEFRGGVEEQLAIVNETLRKPSEATEAVTREFRGWQQIINKSINVLVGNPFLLAQQIGNLIKAPARALIGIENRLLSYSNAIRGATSSTSGTPWDQPPAQSQPRRQIQMANDWRSADLTATYALVSMALAAVETEYKTKPEAFSVADFLLSELDVMAAWRDRGFAVFTGVEYGAQIQVIDDGKAWAAATNTIYLCAGYLVGLAFSLAAERTMVLDRPRTIIDLAAELYGSVDDRLDFLISSNDLCGCEILELPRGKEIVWYPA